ncbi:Myb-like transcription factor [Encephalitozoon intestinalis ATCC 50506]|uniref:Myb-like transcription factor n=1 Tax=Encephalitozoon intestinalis (strain ATCC 50506) TaxID=876142 RepID=E0SA35_ENCIT|nr:Myb-like transcription factor [Encephalitozoon intestinalis ATCC 50506]ADM12657.1 Myb-like transcription factor [Encephalitozoon intestinalis ATCC 50506]UTX46517.1 SANT/Myb-like domain-containing protein [Encephalitozoon intestinalis]
MASLDQLSQNQKDANIKLVKGPWRHEEDEKLLKLVKEFSPKNWSFIAKRLGSRVGKQCRERWHNHLNPQITKKPFTVEEEALIIELHSKFGNRWSEIAKYLPGRTDNAIKNYWNSSIQRRSEKVRRRSMFCSIDEFQKAHGITQEKGEYGFGLQKGDMGRKTKRSISVQNLPEYVPNGGSLDEDDFDEMDEIASQALLRICMSF